MRVLGEPCQQRSLLVLPFAILNEELHKAEGPHFGWLFLAVAMNLQSNLLAP